MAKPKKKRNKSYTPREIRSHMILASARSLGPLEAIIRQIEVDGTILVDAQGNAVWKDLSNGRWYDVHSAITDLIEFFKMYEIRHKRKLPIESLEHFRRCVQYSMPITPMLVTKLKQDQEALQRHMVFANANDAQNLHTQTRIKVALDARQG